jgi:hypothetical protein
MTVPFGKGRISRKERIARAAIGMPALHPEQVARKPGRAEWKQLAAWLAELWPNEEYTAIVTDLRRKDPPWPKRMHPAGSREPACRNRHRTRGQA